MSTNRFATLCAAVVALGWGTAVFISLIVWQPQLLTVDPGFYQDGRAYLQFVAANPVSWRVFHWTATAALLALIPLINLLSHEKPASPAADTARLLGVLGGTSALLASLIDQLATPVLAKWGGLGGIPAAVYIWESMEPVRDDGLKTLSFLLLAGWLLWLHYAGQSPFAGERALTITTRLLAWGLLLLGVVEAMVPPPLRDQLGETGVLAVVLLILPVWALLVARWYWQRVLTTEPHN